MFAKASSISLRDGQTAAVRPLEPTDVDALATYFEGLSARTRGFYGPHPFDRATAQKLCAGIDLAHTARFVAVLSDGRPEAMIVAYMILTRDISQKDAARYAAYGQPLDLAACASFAPSVADAYQEQGLGTAMARHVIAWAEEMGLRQVLLMGGVQARNEHGRRLYVRLGFRVVGEFDVRRDGEVLDNYDMMLDLCGSR